MEIQKHFNRELAQSINDKLLEIQELIEQATEDADLIRPEERDLIQISTKDLEVVTIMQSVYANCALSMHLVHELF